MSVDTLKANCVDLQHHFGGGVYAKETHIPAGVMLSQHIHPFDHLSILASGRAVVQDGEISQEVAGPACLTIRAGVSHSVTAVTDVVWFCVHATDDTDPQTVDGSILDSRG